jgi:hypothetical protein
MQEDFYLKEILQIVDNIAEMCSGQFVWCQLMGKVLSEVTFVTILHHVLTYNSHLSILHIYLDEECSGPEHALIFHTTGQLTGISVVLFQTVSL